MLLEIREHRVFRGAGVSEELPEFAELVHYSVEIVGLPAEGVDLRGSHLC
jgi:hypothetical protein